MSRNKEEIDKTIKPRQSIINAGVFVI